MSFSINGIPNIENIGTLGLYGGATDPSGWVICDGQPRTNTTGTYNNLFLQTTGKNYGYGPTWTNGTITTITPQNWMNVATSSNGQYMLAVSNGTSGGFLYLSANSGAFWSAPLGTGVAYQLAWNGCAVSPNTNSSGYYVMAATVTGQSVYISINSGATWTIPSTLPTAAWSSISMDTDGSIMAVIASGSQIYVSSNSGSTFLPYGTALAYTDIAVSLTGQYMAATVSSGQIYVSTSFGTTWTPYGPTADWLDIHMSGAANIMVAAVNNGPVYISTNTGQAWNTISTSANTTNGVLPTAANWGNIGISSDGAYLVATISGGSIYTSTNGGAFWSNVQTTVTGTSTGASWSNCLAISGNGSTIVAGQSNTSGGTGLLYVSINTVFIKTINASTWTPNSIPASINVETGTITLVDVRGIATSDVGTMVMADRGSTGLFISQNNGLTWSIVSGSGLPSISFSCVDISADGSDIIAAANDVGQGLFLSTNSGSTWSQLYTNNGLPTDLISMDNGSNKVAISNDGTKIAVAYTNGFTYFSSNSGATFQNVSPAGPTGTSLLGNNIPKNYWGLGMSKDGTKLITAVNNGSLVPDLTKTSNVTNPGLGLPASATYGQNAISYTGQYQAVTQSSATAGIWISTNYGNNWKITTGYGVTGGQFGACIVSMSGSGQYIALLNSSYKFSISSTYGANFRVTTYTNTGDSQMAMSYTGQYIICTSAGSFDYSTNYGNYFINVGGGGGGCSISSTGQYMVITSINGVGVSSDYGKNWKGPTSTGGGTNFGQAAMSGSGQYMLLLGWGANNVYVSSTYGAAFYIAFNNANSNQARQAAMSYTGQFMFFNGYYSSNYGVSWVGGVAGRHFSVSATCQYLLSSNSTVELASFPYNSPSQNFITKSWSKISGNGLPATTTYQYLQYSYTGQYVLLATNNQGPLLSTNYGNNWLTTSTGITWPAGAAINVYQVGVSSSGQYMTAVNGKALLSTNYGFNWTQHPGGLSSNPTWQETAVSGNGQYILFMTSATSVIWLSSTSGSNFYQLTNMPVRNLQQSGPGEQVCISNDGQFILLSTEVWPYLSSSYGQFWTQRPGTLVSGTIGTTQFFGPAGMSLSGQYILVMQQGGSGDGNWWVSSSYGAYWKTTSGTPGSNGYLSGSVSGTGQYMAISGSYFYFSTNYGVTWTFNPGSVAQYSYVTISPNAQYMITAGNGTLYGSNFSGNGFSYWLSQNQVGQNFKANPGGLPSSGVYWRGSGVSASGQYILIISNTACYVSSTYGNSFYSASISNRYNCSVSYSGQYMIAGVYNSSKPSLSSTYGATWYTPAIFTNAGHYVRISGNGQYALVGVGSGGGSVGSLYLSTDSGNSWITNPGTGLPASASYGGVGVSSNGQYMFANNYISTNYGNNWTIPATLPGPPGCGNMSGNGKVIVLSDMLSKISISTNYGSSFINNTTMTAYYPDLGISHTGQYIINGKSLSKDYGKSWTTISGITGSIQGSSISMNGNYMLTCVYGGSQYLSVTPNVDGGIAYSTDSGNNWINGGQIAGPYYNSVAISGDGSTILAGYQNDSPLVSVGTSNTFNYAEIPTVPSVPGTNTTGLALSSTGQNAIVTQQGGQGTGSIFTSTSFGSNFTSATIAGTNGTTITDQFYGAASISQNGLVAGAAANGVVYTTTTANTSGQIAFSTGAGSAFFSTQSGTSYFTYASQSITAQAWTSVSISSNGQVMAASSSNSLGGYLYLSTNTGTNWSLNTALSSSQLNLSSVALSTSGQYILVSVSSSNLYVSTNTGTSWTTISNAQPWTEVAVSSDGQAMVAVGTAIQPYVSTNYGKNWSSYGTALNYTSVSLSTTGQYMAAGTTGGQIYLSSNTGANWAVLTNSTTANWTGISMSSTGQFVVASSNLALYLSTNYGLAWTSLANYPGLQNSGSAWSSVSISSDGLFVIASTNTGYIYASINGGATWTLASSVADQQRAWQMISISGDGSKAIAINNPGQVYTSTDGQGFTFTPITMPNLTTLDGTTLRYIAKI